MNLIIKNSSLTHLAYIVLAIALALGIYLRVNNFLQSPPALFIDEADIGYQAYSLLQTGKDYFGNTLPIHLHSFADYRTSLYIYLDVPFIALLGRTTIAVRLPALIFGILSIPLFFLIGRNFFLNEFDQSTKNILGALAAFLLAILPWHIHYSRMAFESTLLLFVIGTGMYLYTKWQQSNKLSLLIFSLICLLLAPYVYSTAKLFIPLVLLVLFVLNMRHLLKLPLSKQILIIGVMIVVALPLVKDTLLGGGAARFSILSVFADKNSIGSYEHFQWLSTYASHYFPFFFMSPHTLTFIFLNNLTNLCYIIGSAYLQTFSPQFLAFFGDPNIRQNLPLTGEAGISVTIFFLIGLYYVIKSRLGTNRNLLLILLLLSPIPSSITVDGTFHATRLFLFILPLILIATFGAYNLLMQIASSKKVLTLVVVLLLVLGWEVLRVQDIRLAIYPYDSFQAWNWGWQQNIDKVNQLHSQYDYVLIDTIDPTPYQTFQAFFSPIPPSTFQHYLTGTNANISIPELQVSGKKYSDTNIIYAIFNPIILDKAMPIKVLAVESVEKFDPQKARNTKIVDIIKDPMGNPAYYLITNTVNAKTH